MSEIFDSIYDSFWFYSKLLQNVIDDLAQIKTKTVKYRPLPHMNGELRRDINVKNVDMKDVNHKKTAKVIKQIVIKSFSYVGKA